MELKKWARKATSAPDQIIAVQTICLGLIFALGMLAGYFYAGYCSGRSQLALSEYLADYCSLYRDGLVQVPPILTVVRLYFSYAVAAFLLGFMPIGVLALPLLSGAYGFVTMFAVSCFVRVYGRSGSVLALAAFGPRAAFTIPCFLWLASWAWASALARTTNLRGKRCAGVVLDGACFYRFFVCIVLLMIGVCVERYITPYLFRWALNRF